MDQQAESHVIHHYDTSPTVTMEVERNSRGYNWRVAVSGAKSVEDGDPNFASFRGNEARALVAWLETHSDDVAFSLELREAMRGG
jgi:hypothetical protein